MRAMRLGLAALFGVALSYTDSNTVKGVTYYYEVTAVNSFGEGPRSNELSARAATEPPATTTTTTTTPGAMVPDAPTLDSAVAHDWGVGLAWSAPASDGGSAVTGYRIYRGIASGAEQSLTGIPNYETASDSSTVNGTTYYYEVSAVNGIGEGPRSNELSVTALGPLRPSLFQPYQATRVGSWPEAVAIGDVTGDGRNDVVMTTSYYFDPVNDYHLFVFAQRPDGTLAPPVSYLTAATNGNPPESVAVGDITGDGKADVVVGLRGLGVQVFPQLPSGLLGAPALTASTGVGLIRLGQLDGDGRLDVASSGASVSVFRNDAQGGLEQPVTYAAQAGSDLEVADVTNDGRDDLVVLSGLNVSVLAQLGGGGFGPAAVYPTAANAWGTHGIGVADVTGDGRNDVVVSYGGNRPTSFVTVLAQGAGGTLAAPVAYPSYDIPEPIDAADVDLDGRADIVTLHGGWDAAGVYRQQADGTPAPEELFGIPYASHYKQQGLAVGDVNGDGSTDIVVADYNSGLVVLRNTTLPVDVPNTPTLTSAVAGSGSVSITWRPPSSLGSAPSGYRVYRGTASGDETRLTTLGNVTSYTDATPANGTTYYYEVSAVNSVGEGARSNELSAKPVSPDSTPPSAPASLKLVVAGTNQLAFDWAASSDNVGVSGYRIYRNGTPVATAGTTEYLDAGLAAGTSYTYRVQALDAAGNASALSSSLNAKTVALGSATTGTLAGAVYDRTGRPLANAVVTLTLSNGSKKTAKTNASGAWKLSNLPPAIYTVTIALAGYTSQTLSLGVVAGKTVLGTAELAPA